MLLPLTPLHEAWGKDSEPGVYIEPKYEHHHIQQYKPSEVNVTLVDENIVSMLHPKTKKERTDIVTNALMKKEPVVVEDNIETFVEQNSIEKYRNLDTHILLIILLLIVAFIDKLVTILRK